MHDRHTHGEQVDPGKTRIIPCTSKSTPFDFACAADLTNSESQLLPLVMYKASDSDQSDSKSINSRDDSSNQNSASVDNYYDSASTQFFDDSASDITSDDGWEQQPWNPLVYLSVGHTSADHDFFWEENIAAWQQSFQDGEYSTDDDMPDLEDDLLVSVFEDYLTCCCFRRAKLCTTSTGCFLEGHKYYMNWHPTAGDFRLMRRSFSEDCS